MSVSALMPRPVVKSEKYRDISILSRLYFREINVNQMAKEMYLFCGIYIMTSE